MDPELRKGFQDLQNQVIETRSKIANIESCQKVTAHDAKINDTILEEFIKDGEDIKNKFFFQPVGRMLVKQEGETAHKLLLERQKQYQEKLKYYKGVKEICINRVKESENSLRGLVNKKLNKSEQATPPPATATTTTTTTSIQDNKQQPADKSTTNTTETIEPVEEKGDDVIKN